MNVRECYESLSETDIEGVKSFPSPPSQMNTAQLPCKYVKHNITTFGVASLDGSHGLANNTFDVVFLIEPIGQSTNITNQLLLLDIIDKLSDFYNDLVDVLSLETSTQVIVINKVPYWGFVCTITFIGT